MNRFLKNIVAKPAVQWSICGVVLAFSLFVLIYYITGPSLGYIHSDCTDSLLWSLATQETGQVLAEDFHYAALLPFGSPLWTVPILSVFGYTITAYKLSMSVFAVLFVLSAFSLFRALKCMPATSALSAFWMCMLLSGSQKLREIMWEHTIYYSIGILFTMLLLNLCVRALPYLDTFKLGDGNLKRNLRMLLFLLLLLLLCVGCGMDGMQVLVISVLPVLGAILAYTLFDEKTRLISRKAVSRYVTCGIMTLGILIGLALLQHFTHGGEISAGYESAYSTWSPLDTWSENAELVIEHYLTLFGIPYGMQEPLFSLGSAFIILKLVVALILLICPFLLLFRYKTLQHCSSKIIAWTHLVVSIVILFGVICGSLSSAEWRLTPMLGSGILATIVYVRELFQGSMVCKRMGAILTALIMLVSILHTADVCSMPYDYGKDREHVVIAQMLEDKGYDYGYATFWNCHITRLLSDDKVVTLPIEIINGEVQIYQHQLRDAWIQQREEEDCFLLLSHDEYLAIQGSNYWADISSRLPLIDSFDYGGFTILVFEGNVI